MYNNVQHKEVYHYSVTHSLFCCFCLSTFSKCLNVNTSIHDIQTYDVTVFLGSLGNLPQ